MSSEVKTDADLISEEIIKGIVDVDAFKKDCHLRYFYDWYLKDVSPIDFHNKVPFPTARKLVYGLYSYFVDEKFVMSDKPDKVFNIISDSEDALHKMNVDTGFQFHKKGSGWETKNRLDGNYYEYETTFDEELTICELLIVTDRLVSRSNDCQHNSFNSWELLEDGETLAIFMDS